MSFEVFVENPDSQYHEGIILAKYNGQFALYLGQKAVDGRVWKRYCKMQTKKNVFADKPIPVKIDLGNQNEAILALKHLLNQLNAHIDDDRYF